MRCPGWKLVQPRAPAVTLTAVLTVALSAALAPTWAQTLAEATPAHFEDPHPEPTQVRTACQAAANQPQTIADAKAALERNPDELGARLNLADALVDQGCYQDAVTVLEAGQQFHPHSSQLTGKLRDVRSMVTEQTYIQGMTQAEETAKLQRNVLRCTRLGDLSACEDALKSKPGDTQLLAARAAAEAARPGGPTAGAGAADAGATGAQVAAAGATAGSAGAQSSASAAGSTEARGVTATGDARAAQRTASAGSNTSSRAARPKDARPAGTASLEVAAASPPASTTPPRGASAVAKETLAAATELTPPPPTYSNDAPAGRTN